MNPAIWRGMWTLKMQTWLRTHFVCFRDSATCCSPPLCTPNSAGTTLAKALHFVAIPATSAVRQWRAACSGRTARGGAASGRPSGDSAKTQEPPSHRSQASCRIYICPLPLPRYSQSLVPGAPLLPACCCWLRALSMCPRLLPCCGGIQLQPVSPSNAALSQRCTAVMAVQRLPRARTNPRVL